MPRQTEILDSTVGLALLPDETLFSWCSRYHQLAANGLDRATCLQLFGHPRIGSAHDFPGRIDALVARSQGALGTAGQVIRDRTLLHFYLPFKPSDMARRAVAAMRGGGIGHLKYQLGLLTGGMGAAHPLKSCPECTRRDLDNHGWAYWRRGHQLPGVWLCPSHGMPLRVSNLKLDQVARFAWVLPLTAGCQPVVGLEESAYKPAQNDWLRRLAAQGLALVDTGAGRFADPIRIAWAFRSRMGGLGMLHPSGRVRWHEVEPRLHRLAANLACLPEASHDADPRLLRGQLVRLLSARSLAHPLRYLIWIAVWFDGLGDFEHVYEDAGMETDEVQPTSAHSQAKPDTAKPGQMPAELLESLRDGSLSLTAAARQLGVSYATVAARACRAAFEPPRRPKKIDTPSWNRALGMLRKGAEKQAVADAARVSVVTVTRILRSVPGLQDEWHRVRHERRRLAARNAWARVSALHVHLGIQGLRRLEPAAYTWLYRNDSDWLKASAQLAAKTPGANHASVRMDRSDARMAEALRHLALSGGGQRTPQQSLDALTRALPALRKAIRSPEQWPQTVEALAVSLRCHRAAHPLLDQADAYGQVGP